MELNYLLSARGIDTTKKKVLVMRHTPQEPELRKALPWLAAERPDIFNAYQQTQRPRVENMLKDADYLVSCIGYRGKPTEALFIGVYKVGGYKLRSRDELLNNSAEQRLQELGGKDFVGNISDILWFDLKIDDSIYHEWKGKLILNWPPPPIRWAQWCDPKRCEPKKPDSFSVKAILEESTLDKEMPDWNKLILSWHELKNLPTRWIDKLSEWRGVYFIFDAKDGKGYVGSAYGEYNLFRRWKEYADTGDGGNTLLRERKPDKFSFSILERVSPDEEPNAVLILENNWKDRLHTRKKFGGLNVN